MVYLAFIKKKKKKKLLLFNLMPFSQDIECLQLLDIYIYLSVSKLNCLDSIDVLHFIVILKL